MMKEFKSSRSTLVAEYVKERILRREWGDGDRIDDKELSETLGVSRLSTREALSRLVEQRVLTQVHWKGYFVRRLDWPEVFSTVEMRRALENLALKLCLDRAKNPANPWLAGLLEEIDRGIRRLENDLISGDRNAFDESDFQIHQVLFRFSENPWILHISGQIAFVIHRLRLLDNEDDFQSVAKSRIAEHKEIRNRVAALDRKGAMAAMNTQSDHFRSRLEAQFQNKDKHDDD